MHFQEINLGETHIRLKTDLANHYLKNYIYSIRLDLKSYIAKNQDFLLSIEPIKLHEEDLPIIVKTMYESSLKADVGPMACVAGTISELSLNYLIENDSKTEIHDIIRHIEHYLSLDGQAAIAIGSDLDGITHAPHGIKRNRDLLKIAEEMERLGYPCSLIQNLFYKNADNFFGKYIKR